MSERLSVAVRVRPFLPHESLTSCVAVNGNHISIGGSKSFAFDRVFDMNATSDDVYVTLGQPLADSFLAGYHASTIAYGQTGAGKTFTMTALLRDTVQEIFCRLAEEEGEASHSSVGASPSSTGMAAAAPTPTPPFTMSLTVLEVYNEAVGDLLSRHAGQPSATSIGSGGGGGGAGNGQRGGFASDAKKAGPTQRGASLQLREDPTGGVCVVGLTEIMVGSEARLLALIDDAIGNRKTASTFMNATSSRSHCVITLTLHRRGLCSRCCFVDLAGSERLKKSLGGFGSPTDRYGNGSIGNGGSSGGGGGGMGSPPEAAVAPGNVAARMREGININSGLLALGNVIVALCERKAHVPYRSSKLTRLLQPMLEGHSLTAMIACVAPLASSLEETLNTLKYADRAKRIQINPHLAVAPTNSAADTQQLINLLREQLEEARRRLAAMAASHNGEKSRGGGAALAAAASPGALPLSTAPSSSDEVEQLRELLVQEQEITRRLENDLFNAEYTTMVEVEKRKALESRVAQLEEYVRALRDSSGFIRSQSERESAELWGSGTTAATNSSNNTAITIAAPPSPRARLTMNLAKLQQLEEERESLAAMRAKRVRDTQRLEAALAAGETPVANDGCDEGNGGTAAADVDAAAGGDDATTTMAHLTMDQLTEEIQHKESQIAQLQKENDEVSAQLAQFERELQNTLAEKTKLQEELRRAEAQLERSAMEKEQKEQEKATLRASYVERIRRAEVRASEYQKRVREAEKEVRVRQESIDRTRQLQERVMQLREEVTRQRQEVRSTKKQADQLSAAHQHEVLQLQRQLQLTTAQVAQLHQRMDRKDAAIAKVKKQLAEQQAQLQVQQPSPPPQAPHTPSPPPGTPPPPPPTSTATATTVEAAALLPAALHKIPANKQASSRRISLKQPVSATTSPSTVSLSDTPPGGTSPVRITKRRQVLPVAPSSPSTQREAAAAQAQINRELRDLERMEKELAELQEYREVLRSAQTTDAPKWHRAKEGFTRRLAAVQAELQTVDAASPAHANLVKEEADVREKLRQLQTYRHMFEDADEQLAEFENRIENLNEARKFHLQNIRRLQQQSAARARKGEVTGRIADAAGIADGEVSLPSVREIHSTRLAYSVSSLSHKSTVSDTPPLSPLDVLKSSGDNAAYTAALEQQVARLKEETQALPAQLRAL
jgi:DNA repair exonuclease SbcCD ATPase subunit